MYWPRARRAEVVPGDLADRGFAERLCAGADAVVHLAGNPRPGDDWDQLRGPSIEMATGVLAAAAEAGVRRVLLASSVHVLGGYSSPAAEYRDIAPDGPSTMCRRGWD
ncbi:NAD-dependent epimerase/dehydratase family protein [Nonomuraea sp. NPDC000554]|uniref:NAD-dependent epimerase/dehydratase family protein n=1 Tax=Nonomuraea sp. NPDC000554 TaxID=3154259 RepID=UPI003319C3AD